MCKKKKYRLNQEEKGKTNKEKERECTKKLSVVSCQRTRCKKAQETNEKQKINLHKKCPMH